MCSSVVGVIVEYAVKTLWGTKFWKGKNKLSIGSSLGKKKFKQQLILTKFPNHKSNEQLVCYNMPHT